METVLSHFRVPTLSLQVFQRIFLQDTPVLSRDLVNYHNQVRLEAASMVK